MPHRIYHNDIIIPKELINIRQLKQNAYEKHDIDLYCEYYAKENEYLVKWELRMKKLNSL